MIVIQLKHKLGLIDLNVDVRLPSHGLTVLFGRSGSGKTSVVNMLAGLTHPSSGRVEVNKQVLLDTEVRINVPTYERQLGYIFQEARLFPHLSVRANLNYGYVKDRQIRFDEVVELLGIGHLLARRPHHLSGGEKQRVAIGRALLTNPRLLLMDEPLSALDESRKDEIIPFIVRIRDEFFTPVIYVTHSLTEVRRLANNVVIMTDGASTHSGSLDEIMPLLDGSVATVAKFRSRATA